MFLLMKQARESIEILKYRRRSLCPCYDNIEEKTLQTD